MKNKKHFAGFVFFTAVFSTALRAQFHKLEYGFTGGINRNSYYSAGSGTANRGSINGIHLGIHLKRNINKHVGFKTMLLYDQKGWKLKDLYFSVNFVPEKAEVIINLDYLSLPLLVEYTAGDQVKFKLNGGILLSSLLSNQYTEKYEKASINTIVRVAENRSKFVFGVMIGTGVQIPINKKLKMELDISQDYGLTPADDPGGSTMTKTFAGRVGCSFVL